MNESEDGEGAGSQQRSRAAGNPPRAPERSASRLSRLRAWLLWMGRHELGVLISLLALALGGLGFVKVASEVSEGDTQHIDRVILLALRSPTNTADPIGPPWVEESARDLSALGGTTVLTLLTIAVVGYLVLIRRPRSAAFVAASIVGAAVLAGLLKELFGRPRPELVPHLAYVSSSSFPSGHSMVSTAVYLTLGALLARMHPSLLTKAYVLLWALCLGTLVGMSRVYLGVHWPSDVLAGWAAGAAWAALCWIGARLLQRKGLLERPGSRRELE